MYTYKCTYTYAHTHACMHTHTRMHTHTYTQTNKHTSAGYTIQIHTIVLGSVKGLNGPLNNIIPFIYSVSDTGSTTYDDNYHVKQNPLTANTHY